MHWKTLLRSRTSACCVGAALLAVVPVVAQAAPCAGIKRLQVRWSQPTATALVAFSATVCDRPPDCAAGGTRSPGTMFTKSPITVSITDARGHSLSGVVDAGAASCTGKCERVNRGGCLGGADTHRLGSSFVRYVVNTQGQTTVVANKLKLPATEAPDLVSPITVTIRDAAGYAVAAELQKCRVRRSAKGAAIACS